MRIVVVMSSVVVAVVVEELKGRRGLSFFPLSSSPLRRVPIRRIALSDTTGEARARGDGGSGAGDVVDGL